LQAPKDQLTDRYGQPGTSDVKDDSLCYNFPIFGYHIHISQ